MISVRPFEPGDLGAAIALHRECFPAFRQRSPAEVDRKYKQLFVDSPFRDPRLPSLVACEPDGTPVGFLGVLVRSWSLRGDKVPCRTVTGLAVHPAYQGQGVSRSISSTFKERREAVHGGHSFGFSDRSTSAGIGVFLRAVGEILLDGYGFTWEIPVRRLAARIRHLEATLLRRTNPTGRLRRVARMIGGSMERILPDDSSHIPQRPALRRVSPSTGTLHEALSSVGEAYPLRIDEDTATVGWLLDYLQDYPSRGRLLGSILCGQSDRPVGFYLGYLQPSSRKYEVVAFGARPDVKLAVYTHLLQDVYDWGAVSASGRASAADLRPLLECGALIRAAIPPTLLTHSEEIKQLFFSVNALTTGLESEGWI